MGLARGGFIRILIYIDEIESEWIDQSEHRKLTGYAPSLNISENQGMETNF